MSELRDACVKEALRLINEVGVEKLSIREVARRLGVSHQAPYKHFPSSDHLLAEVLRQAYLSFGEYLRSRSVGPDPETRMKNLGIAYYEYAMKHPANYRLMFSTPLPDATQHPEMLAEAKTAFGIVLESLAAERGKVQDRVDQLDALFIWAALHGLATIMKSPMLKEIGLGKAAIADVLPHALGRIKTGIHN
jgi:AcrR family transcriptional regulator